MATLLKRTLRDGTRRYDVQIRRAGIVRKKTFRTRVAADRWARLFEAALDDDRQLPTGRQERRTFAEAVEGYLMTGLPGLRSAPERRAHLAWWSERVGAVPLIRLTKEEIRWGLAALEAGDTPRGRPASGGTRRRYLASLRSFLAWCVDCELMGVNPARGAGRKGLDVDAPGRVRYLDDEERGRLLAACETIPDERLLPLVQLALLSGARQGELLGLEWTDLDLDRGLASLAVTKNGRPRPVALSAAAVAILRELQTKREPGQVYVFPNPVAKTRPPAFPRDAWELAVRAAELSNFRFHDLRHTYASYLLTEGASLVELAAALGHRTLAMVQRYAHLERPHAARLAEKVARRVQGAGLGVEEPTGPDR
jgi:integrase